MEVRKERGNGLRLNWLEVWPVKVVQAVDCVIC